MLTNLSNAVRRGGRALGLYDDGGSVEQQRQALEAAQREKADADLARTLQEVEQEHASAQRGADRSSRSGRKAPSRKRPCAGDAAFARALQADEYSGGCSGGGDDEEEEVIVLDAKVARTSAKAERDAIRPFARHIDRTRPQLELELPTNHLLVSAATFKVLKWGLGGHRDALRNYCPELHELAQRAPDGQSRVPLESQQLAAHRGEWEQLPICVPQMPPREGFVYVTHEANDKINVGSELYHRIYVEEGALPKQMALAAYELALERSKEAERASRADRKRFGGTASLGVKLQVVKTARNGDCFFDSLCKAFSHGEARPFRNPQMWRDAAPLLEHSSGSGGGGNSSGAGGGSSSSSNVRSSGRGGNRGGGAAGGGADGGARRTPPDESVPLTVRELRAVVATHFPEEAWLIGQSIGGESFAFIVDDSFELTKANVAALAEDAADRAYWADETAIAILQRYLGVRLLIFNPLAAEGNKCNCLGEVPLQPGRPSTYVLLCHTHRSSKTQHYELYAQPPPPHSGQQARPVAVFEENTLPAGVKRAFATACPGAPAEWRTARDPHEAAEAGEEEGEEEEVMLLEAAEVRD